MRKNPGRKERRRITKKNREELSDKKKAVNERKMLWLSKFMRTGKERHVSA